MPKPPSGENIFFDERLSTFINGPISTPPSTPSPAEGDCFFLFHTMQNLQIDRARVHQSMGHIEKKNETHVYVQRLLTLLLFKQIDI